MRKMLVHACPQVYVIDENDNFPTITRPAAVNETIFLRTDVDAGQIVATVVARDPDDGPNAMLTFSIVVGNDDSAFRIDEYSGDVTAARSIDATRDARIYALMIAVRDGGTPRRVSTAHLVVVVNASAPLTPSEVVGDGGGVGDGGNIMVIIGIACGTIVLIKVVAIVAVCVRLNRHHGKVDEGGRVARSGVSGGGDGSRTISDESISDRLCHIAQRLGGGGVGGEPSNHVVVGGGVRPTDCRVKKEVMFSIDGLPPQQDRVQSGAGGQLQATYHCKKDQFPSNVSITIIYIYI